MALCETLVLLSLAEVAPHLCLESELPNLYGLINGPCMEPGRMVSCTGMFTESICRAGTGPPLQQLLDFMDLGWARVVE